MEIGELSFNLVCLIIMLFQPRLCQCGAQERQILDLIFRERRYSKFERPVTNESEPIIVTFSLTLQQIIDVDEKNQIVHSNLWLNMKWKDPNLAWNKTQFPNVPSIRLPADQVWRPDILLYNSAHINIDGTYPTHVVIKDDGSCLWVPPGIFLSTCRINIKWFPFDDQMCELKFGSWTHEGGLLDLRLETEEADQTSLLPNGEWIVIGMPAARHVVKYECCPEEYIDVTFTLHIRRRSLFYVSNLVVPCMLMSSLSLLVFVMPPESGEKVTCGFPGKRNILKYDCCPEEYIDLTFTLHIRRRSLFYTFNLVVPCAMISSMEFLTFTLPPESGEKISLGVTILLSLTVFSMMVSESMPQTSDAVPLIGTYFASIMLMCSLTVVFTVVVLNFHHRTSESHSMPIWVRKGICEWLAWILRMQRPGRNVTFRSLVRTAKMQDLEMSERSSRSLLANVLDLEDDFRRLCPAHIVHVNHLDNKGSLNSPADSLGGVANQNGDVYKLPSISGGRSGVGGQSINGGKVGGANNRPPTGQSPWLDGSGAGAPSAAGLSEMRDILKELKTITGRIKKDESTQEVLNDWRFAALVIDRLCLYLFVSLTAVTTCAILLQAPHFA